MPFTPYTPAPSPSVESKGAANGIASLDAGAKVPATQLPSYVDDVLEYASTSAFPAEGETGKIYVALDTNKSYRWSGSTYVELSSYAEATQSASGLMSSTDKAKLDGIESGAQVNPSNQTICNLIYPVGSIYMSVNSTSPATLFGGTWEQMKDKFLLGAGDTYTAGNTGGAASQSYTPAGTVGGHTLTSDEIPSHSHGLNSHTHSVGAHSHGLNSHTHTGPSHTHTGPSHKHSVGAHSHGLNSHTHTYTDYYANTTSGSTTLTVDQIPSHNHHAYGTDGGDKFIKHGPSGNAGAADFVYQSGLGTGTCATITANTGGGKGHTHSVSNTSTTRTSNAASGSTANSTAFDSGSAGTGNTGAAGTGNTGAASGSTANSTAFNSGAATGNTAATGGGGSHNHSFTGTQATINTMPPYLVVYMWKRTA